LSKKKHIFILLLCCFSNFIWGQKDPEFEYIHQNKYLKPDECLKKSRELLTKYDDSCYCIVLNFIGDIQWHKGQLDSSLYYYNSSLNKAVAINSKWYIAKAKANAGYILFEKTKYNESLKLFLEAIDIYKTTKETNEVNTTLSYIGQVYYYLGKYTEAKKIFQELAIDYEHKKEYYNASVTYEMLANIVLETDNLQKAESYYKLAIENSNLANNKKRSAEVLINYGSILLESSKADNGEALILSAISYLESTSSIINIGTAYNLLANSFLNKKDYVKAKKYYEKAISYFSRTDKKHNLVESYQGLSKIYESEKNFEKSLSFYKNFKELSDTINHEMANKDMMELTTKYDVENKEKENQILTAKNELSNKTIKQQKVISYFIIGVLILISGFAFFILKSLKKQRQANAIISKQKQEVESQKHIIEEHQKEIVDSINYAKKIQTALLANQDLVNRNIANNFILFQPKDIVSGDFYWATEHQNKFYLAVCDCTGHGVPGAFMSLLNIGFLSEAIKEKNISKANEIFNYVRERLIQSIGAEGQRDGMDGILICIDKTNQEVTYAAANNEPILISEDNIIELPKDRMPVGKGERKEDFKLHSINLKPSDTLYLYTDGYADQFGGPKGKKFKYKRLNELRLSIITNSLDVQKQELEKVITNWRGELEQVDDICVIGIKI